MIARQASLDKTKSDMGGSQPPISFCASIDLNIIPISVKQLAEV